MKVNLYYSDGITTYKDYFNPNIKGKPSDRLVDIFIIIKWF